MDGHSERTELMVSRRWHALIINTSLLWTRAFLSYCEDYDYFSFTELAGFKRSNVALMDVYWTVQGRPVIDPDYNLIVQHAHRIRNLIFSFELDNPDSIFGRGWATCKMPQLSSLSLELLPKLHCRSREASLRHIQAWPEINSLQKLELISFVVAPDILKLLFQRFPHLETLILRGFEPFSNIVDGPQDTSISATFLRYVVLQGWFHKATCVCGLCRLDAPNVEVLETHGPRRTKLNDGHVTILVKSDPARTRKLRVCNPKLFTAIDI